MRLIAFMVFVFLSINASADVVVIYDSKTKDIYSISDKADAVVPEGHVSATLPGKAEDYQETTKDYQLVNGRLKLNAEKVQQREEAERVLNDRQEEIEAIRKKSLKVAYEQLKSEGYQFKELTDKDFQ